tara:strand:- start:2785 stop:2982 length:198 start_codon:yes stop_codon:yes gene_type:complete
MKTEEEVKAMLLEAEEEAKYWRDRFHSRTMDTKQNAECLRNYTALRGVKKTLRWVLENKAISPLR